MAVGFLVSLATCLLVLIIAVRFAKGTPVTSPSSRYRNFNRFIRHFKSNYPTSRIQNPSRYYPVAMSAIAGNRHGVSGTSPVWSAELGTWQDAQVPGYGIDTLPHPLYVFGYGSLLWKPGKYLEDLPCYEATCLGWRRMFNQLSCDHRGTVAFPGLVLTLVDQNYLQSAGLIEITSSINATSTATSSTSSSSSTITASDCCCMGAIWEIPDELVVDVVAELDYREKGGYQRQLIKVQLQQDTSHYKAGDIADALVYIAATDNPNFYRPLHQGNVHQHITQMVTDIVSVAVGPSGANIDYLLNLVDYLSRPSAR